MGDHGLVLVMPISHPSVSIKHAHSRKTLASIFSPWRVESDRPNPGCSGYKYNVMVVMVLLLLLLASTWSPGDKRLAFRTTEYSTPCLWCHRSTEGQCVVYFVQVGCRPQAM
jgi:hypothetical protein